MTSSAVEYRPVGELDARLVGQRRHALAAAQHHGDIPPEAERSPRRS